jgi:RNA polymerase sigma-70 factor (ECF subfamily)
VSARSGLNPAPTNESDTILMLQVRDDVPGAFDRLVTRVQGRLLGVLTHLLGDRDAAEDLAQDVLLRLYRSRRLYQPTARFSTWLFTIANNVVRNHRRGLRRRAQALPTAPTPGGPRPAEQVPAGDPGVSTQLRRVELAEVVRAALGSLNEDQRLAVLLNKFEGMGYAEIASVMGRSEDAVKSLMARARYNLKILLTPYLTDGLWPDDPPGAA